MRSILKLYLILVFSFFFSRTAAARDLWWSRLSELVREENLKEPPDTNIQVVYHDTETTIEYVSVPVNNKFCKTTNVSF